MLSQLKLSTEWRQLERQKWELPKKFPFLHGLNVKRGIPSPLNNLPMRVGTLPHGRRLVYGLSCEMLSQLRPVFSVRQCCPLLRNG